ncbi:phosphate signaling complex protein PhoU [Porphyromonas loveana]|uniref:phosphate signaling complex protein PhoU n=1 Tax=Porphyromonas loveana TaxID=1884669 RepID=UPI0035A150E3
MKHTEQEMIHLKEEVKRMWQLVLSQLEKARLAFLTHDSDVAREVISREKRVDVYELKIESDCENYIALYSPVAVDLRLTLSLMKICNTLERIGDFAAGIALHVLDDDCQGIPDSLVEKLEMEQMFDVLQGMLSDCYVALENENTKLTGRILSRDNEVNAIYHTAPKVLSEFMAEHPEHIYCGLKLLLLIRKLERIGDHCSNIVEEIVFYVDAKVLKHSKNQNG